jgi:hypothetical protein
MTERSYQDTVQVLQQRMSARWEGLETNGRDEMVRILKEDLGYSSRQANEAIDAMIESGTLRYHGLDTIPVALPGAPVGTGVSGGPVPPVPVTPTAGYWQIGEGAAESSGRKGQVDPT